MAVEEAAPAKINLALHVTGRRADGRHELDSLVVFADLADRVRVARADADTLNLTGPEAAGLSTQADNLALRAARFFAGPKVAIALEKVLPVAAGLGGGSADAAAVLRALARLTGRPVPDGAEALGADVPVCLKGTAQRMRSIGERLAPAPALPACDAVLVNPRVALSTGAVFAARPERASPPLPPLPARFGDARALIDWLAATRNDLAAPAEALAPAIGQVRAALSALPGARLVRMSGSGASVFALFESRAAAEAGAARLGRANPGWWVRAVRLS